jgi:hypothetical protein
MIERQIDRPIPMPVGFVVKNASNNVSRCLGSIPVPLSITETNTPLPRRRRDRMVNEFSRPMVPAIAWMPLTTRLMTTCCN